MTSSQTLRESLFRQGVARYLVDEMSLYARGAADSQHVVVDNRPRDVVITGVLLPRQPPDGDVAHVEFLERVRPSTMGLTFRVSAACRTISVNVAALAFLRVMPTRKEQLAYGRPRVARTVYARTRLHFEPVTFDLATALENGVAQHSFPSSFVQLAGELSGRCLFPKGLRALPEDLQLDAISDDAWRQRCDLMLASSSPCMPAIRSSLMLSVVTGAEHHEVSITLSNDSPDDASERDIDGGLFDASLTVSLRDEHDKPVAPVPYELELPVHGYLYDRRQFAAGRNCNAEWDPTDATLNTRVIPVTKQHRFLPVEEVAIPAARLAGSTQEAVRELRRLAAAMSAYDGSAAGWSGERDRVRSSDRAREMDEFDRARSAFSSEIAAFTKGIEILEHPDMAPVAKAFGLANETMRRLWGDEGRWRAFQIVWIVSLLGCIARREYPDHPILQNTKQDDDRVEVLWFPTGGGKTEAFLGVLLVQAFFDRLRGRERGPVAFLRFPLRLLTLQQYQRLLKILVVAEQLRLEHKLGGRPYCLGMLIGKQGSPNKIDEAKKDRDALSKYRKVRDCPYRECGKRDSIEIYFDDESLLTRHRCKACERTLPVYVVDEDVFRIAPTFIVSTVDKLALIGWQHLMGNVLGRPYGFDLKTQTALQCPKHGALLKPSGGDLKCSRDCGLDPERVSFKDPAPSFLVVDELHLLQEDLGTFDAHYETAVMELMTAGPSARPWKVLAATATIERYEKQVEELWCMPAKRFPGSGPRAGESFYARDAITEHDQTTGESIPSPPRRIFFGVMPTVKTTINAAVIMLRRQYELIQGLLETRKTNGAQAVVQRVGCDPGSVPEGDGVDKVLDEFDCTLTYVLNRRAADQLAESVRTQLSEQLSELGIPPVAVRILTSGTQTSEILETMERVDEIDRMQPDPTRRIRALIATSLVSHGVDLSRLNWMMFYGMPFLVAEYIQAGSRVGRTNVGLVLVVFAPNNERDRSVYHRFVEFHRHIDALVEPSAIERDLPLAFRRTVPGLLAGLALQERTRETNNASYLYEEFARLEKLDPRYTREATISRILELLRLPPEYDNPAQRMASDRVAYLSSQIETNALLGDARKRRELISKGVEAMTSLRDVDEEVMFEPLEQSIAAFSPIDEKLRNAPGEFQEQPGDEED